MNIARRLDYLIEETEASKILALQRLDQFKESLAKAKDFWAKHLWTAEFEERDNDPTWNPAHLFLGTQVLVNGILYRCTYACVEGYPGMLIKFGFRSENPLIGSTMNLEF